MAPARAVMPVTGYPIDGDGLWQTYAKGISLANLVHSSTSSNTVLNVLATRINSTEVGDVL